MTATDIKTRAATALAALGDTPDAIADRLRALGIKGWRGSESTCPIAVYLARVDQTWSTEVVERTVLISDDEITTVEVDVPEPVSLFVRRFDKGVYLDLADGQVP